MKLIDTLTSPWAIEPSKLREIQEIYTTHLRGEKIDLEAIEARLGRPLANEQQDYSIREGGIAVLSIEGVIAPKANLFTRVSGGASAQVLNTQVESAIADPRVKALVIAGDSPGGSVFGGPELAATVFELSKVKPIVTVSDGMMASLMYWIGSAANRVFISGPTVMVGSIGVVGTHNFKPRGATSEVTTEIVAGRYKRIASDQAPLTEEGRAYLQAQVDHIYGVFVDAVAQHRGVSAEAVLEHMADGRVFVGQQAIDAGLVDGVATVDAAVEQLATDPQRYARRARATVKTTAPAKKQPVSASAEAGAPSDEAPTPLKPQGNPTMLTREQLAAEAPELLNTILAEGAATERARIQAVEGAVIPGHEALIAAMKFDGKSTGGDAALAVNAAERALRGRAATALANDAPKPLAAAATPAVDNTAALAAAAEVAANDKSKPVEERCKTKWDADAGVRAEFGTFEGFVAFTRASELGKVRVLGHRTAA